MSDSQSGRRYLIRRVLQKGDATLFLAHDESEKGKGEVVGDQSLAVPFSLGCSG
jgi:hypothetical protein